MKAASPLATAQSMLRTTWTWIAPGGAGLRGATSAGGNFSPASDVAASIPPPFR